MRAWPELPAALLDRSTERVYSQLLQSALRQAKHVEDRVLLALWHFAERWGQVGPEGRIVKLPNMTGEILARIVGARRQSVSTALGALTTRGAIHRRPDGSWVVPDQPPQLERIQARNRAPDPILTPAPTDRLTTRRQYEAHRAASRNPQAPKG